MAPAKLRGLVVSAIVVAVGLAALFGTKGMRNERAHAAQTHRGATAVTVEVAAARSVTWQSEIHTVANLVAVQGVHLTTQLAGQVRDIYFRSGQHVRKGERLLQLDDSTQRAQLASDQAAAELAKVNYERAQRLFGSHAASESDVQTARSSFETAKAAVAGDQATLAKLALTAPFSGWLGLREVSVGQYLVPGTGIATLAAWDPVRVQFTVPQRQMALIQVGQAVRIDVDAFEGQVFGAKVTALGSEVDPNSRNIGVEATLSNPKQLLRPGMFARAQLLVGEPQPVLAVPTAAITYNTFGDFVYRVENRDGKKVAVATPVSAGETRDELTQIQTGLKAGDEVVTAGQVKLHDGAPVSVTATK
jgi:membrane fusion protein, multidrug efflux system